MNLTGRTALVTGAGRGIGRGCAIELARAGADIALNDRQPSPDTDATLAEIRAFGRKAILVDGDAFERTSVEGIVQRAIAGLGKIDILVSNPAYSKRGDFLNYDPTLFERTLQATLTAGFHASQLVARHMVERNQGGKIVFISSVHARIPYAASIAYNAAKSGLNHMARTIAAELIQYRINVNLIEPGWIDTPGEHIAFGDDAIKSGAELLPWKRLGTPEDIGQVATFLCSPAADYITGTSILVDGGYTLREALPVIDAKKD